MEWQYFWHLFKGVLWNEDSFLYSLPAYASFLGAVAAFILWFWPNLRGERMKTIVELLQMHPALVIMNLLMVSVILTSYSIYVNKPSNFATINELIPSVLQHKNIRVVDLAMQDPIIRNRTFEDCQIYGPAVFLNERCNMYDCDMDAGREAGFIKTSNAILWGVIKFQDCVFRRCSFYKIGFIGLPEDIDKIKSQMNFVDGPMP